MRLWQLRGRGVAYPTASPLGYQPEAPFKTPGSVIFNWQAGDIFALGLQAFVAVWLLWKNQKGISAGIR